MAISGTAFAQGLLSGAGQAGQRYFEDMRRQRLDDLKLQKTFDMFTKQTDYSAAVQAEKEKGVAMYKVGLEDIEAKNTQRSEWERVSKLSTKDIVYENALKFGENFAPTDRPAAIRDYLKRKSGVNKAAALNDRGLTLPDYSQYKDKPEYADAIPKQYLAGDPAMPDADSVFKFDPQAGFMQEVEAQAEKLDVYDKKKRDAISVIKDSTLITFQAEPSQAVAEYLWLKRPGGEDVQMKGADVISQDNTRIASMIQAGQLVKIGGQLKFKTELDENERQLLGIAPQAPSVEPTKTPTGKETDLGYEYEVPATAQFLEEEETEKARIEMDKNIKAMSKELGTGKGTPLTTHTELTEAVQSLDALSDDALNYLFDAGFSNETVRDLAAKFGKEDAQKAKDLIAKMSGSVNAIRHELFGSALTEGEAAKFREQFSDIGVFNNKENLRNQLMNLIRKAEMGVVEKTAGFTPEAREEFVKRNPAYKGLMAATKPTVSDSSYSREGVTSYVDQLIQSGQYDQSQREALINYMVSKAGIQ